ncbi:MAG: hypothetical protein KBA06_04775 [Saprospiraceae bacterium]|nr:hypothetical protein [Saprospiraceae bacterium]
MVCGNDSSEYPALRLCEGGVVANSVSAALKNSIVSMQQASSVIFTFLSADLASWHYYCLVLAKMHIMLYKQLIFLFLLFGITISCNKNLLVEEDDVWESEWLAPLIKTRFTMDQLRELNDTKYEFNIPSIDLGFAENILVDVPELNISHLGPYQAPVSDWVKEIQIDTLALDLEMTNIFPISIGAGTKFVLRNSTDTLNPASIIAQIVIQQDIPPGGLFKTEIKSVQSTIGSNLYFYLDAFRSQGGNQVSFNSSPCKININLKVIDLKRIDLYTNQQVVSTDTFKVELGDTLSSVNDTLATGLLDVMITNGLPVSSNMQLYFLNANKSTVIDSLFNVPLLVEPGTTSSLGETITETNASSSISLNGTKIQHIRQSTYAVIQYELKTPSSGFFVSANDHAFLQMKLIGDLKLHLNPNN